MASTWFVVLSQSNMKIFTRRNLREPLSHLQTIANNLNESKEQDPAKHEPDFAREVAHYLDDQRKKNQYKELWVAAEPRFMGLVKKSLSDETSRMVREWIVKDLEKADVTRLGQEFSPSTSVLGAP